ncbi:MAG: hypothetical protein HZA22_11285 [Nitrospirae bacterium]|nr:hypothetical protein [Nitrospirota bacterium]
MNGLVELAQMSFEDITEEETALISASEAGVVACFGKSKCGALELPDGESPANSIRPELLYWMCTDEEAIKLIHARGVQIIGAKFDKDLFFDYAELLCPLAIFYCSLHDVILVGASTKSLYFNGSSLCNFMADGLDTEGDVILNDANVRGSVRLLGANITGNFECMGSVLGVGDKTVSANNQCKEDRQDLSEIDYKALNLKKRKEKRLLDTQTPDDHIKRIKEPSGFVLNADGSDIKVDVRLDYLKAYGEVSFVGGNLGGDFVCTKAEFNSTGDDGRAFTLDGHINGGDIFLDNVVSNGEIRLLGEEMRGDLICRDSVFKCVNAEKSNGNAFYADELIIEGNVFFERTKCFGTVSLHGADVGNRIDFASATLANGPKSKIAMTIENADIDGTLSMQDVNIEGHLILAHAKVRQLSYNLQSWPKPGYLHIDGFQYHLSEGKSKNKL